MGVCCIGVQVHELLGLSFGVVNGVGGGMGVLDGGLHAQGEEEVLWVLAPLVSMCFNGVFVEQKYIRLVRDKLVIFTYGQYIIAIHFTGFPKIWSSLRTMLGFARNLLKCNTHFRRRTSITATYAAEFNVR